jgi:IMP dehydrogenase/GMP reductase
MAGGMFASHYESGGDIVEINGKLFKQFYGTPLFPRAIPP